MLESGLLMLLSSCIIVTILSWVVISWDLLRKKANINSPILIIPVSEDTNNIEYIVRELIFKLAEQDIHTEIVLLDKGAEKDTIGIFKKLMIENNEYVILKVQ